MVNQILMEDYFNPGFKSGPLVHIGSQTHVMWTGIEQEQAMEGFHLSAVQNHNVGVVRNFDPLYINYWKSLNETAKVINLLNVDTKKYLSEVLLENPLILNTVKEKMHPNSRLMTFFITELEEKLAQTLGIPLHGSMNVSKRYGTKSGIRLLADKASIAMASGSICGTLEDIYRAIEILRNNFESVVIKHDLSASGYWSKKIDLINFENAKGQIKEFVENISKQLKQESNIFVVEGWLKSKASLCAHIEIIKGKEPIICAAWEQIIDSDGISYVGAGPLQLSTIAFESFRTEVQKLATVLTKEGVEGSFGPDFLITSEEETNFGPDKAILIELNARAPVTAFPLELIKHVKGKIGSGFLSSHIKLKKPAKFIDIKEILEDKNLLILKKDDKNTGVIPFNIGMLPWKTFDVVVMADSWEETKHIMLKVKSIFEE